MLIDPNKTLFINSRGPVGAAVKEAPVDGKSYVRKDGGWSEAVASEGGDGFSGNYNDLTGKPALFDGVYSSLSGKPDIPSKIEELDVTIVDRSDGEMLVWDLANSRHSYQNISEIMSKSGALLSAPHLVWKVQNVLFSNELQINISEGNVIIISALTNNITHKVPLRIPAFGTRVIYYFTQDPTGGRTITWSTAHKGIVSTTGGNNSQQLRVEFESTGTELIFVSSSGWY